MPSALAVVPAWEVAYNTRIVQSLLVRVFLSSTCYDLIDLRAELEVFLKNAGVVPVLSDSIESEFQPMPDRNSIESCIANVRSCDQVIVILSSRYGPNLMKAGYEDISATQLEYREAKNAKKPILFYVRDRLKADFAIWNKNGKSDSVELSWIKRREDRRLFNFLEEHRNLQHGSGQTNWFYCFRNSVELKQRIEIDLKEAFFQATALRLFESARLPFIEICPILRSSNRKSLNIEVTLRNFGASPAIYPIFRVDNTINSWELPSLPSMESTMFKVEWSNLGHDFVLKTGLTYSMIDGHKVRDEGELYVKFNSTRIPSARYQPKQRVYLGRSGTLSVMTQS